MSRYTLLREAFNRLGRLQDDGLEIISSHIANLHRRLGRRISSPRDFIARLGKVTTCITICTPPIAYAILSTCQLQSRAVEQASLGARHVESQLTKYHGSDSLSQVSTSVVYATPGANSAVVASWLTDETGTTLMFSGSGESWPELHARVPVRSVGFTGSFNVAVSTRDVFIGTAYVSAAFLLLGLAAYYCFQRLPLAALDDALHLLEAKQDELLSQRDKLETQNLRFDAALSNMSQGLCMFDGDHKLVVCNTRYAQMYGLPPELASPGTSWRQIIDHRISQGLHSGQVAEEYLRDLLTLISEQRLANKVVELNNRCVIAIRHQPMPGGGWISTHDDITNYRRIEARITHLANHDALTDLPNRLLLRERLERALANLRDDKGLAVLSLDLDRFKDVNDLLGHTVGDGLLKAVGDRLRHCARDSDFIARLSADEFAIVQIATEQPIAATALATRILEAIGDPFEISGHMINVGASLGIAIGAGDGASMDQLLKNADLALQRAKREGRGVYRFFEPDMDAHMQARRQLQLDLGKGLANGEFELHYQPLVNLQRNEISCLEALLRWHHPERGSISPVEFIPLAEETGLIVPIGEWALRQACADAATWPEDVKVAVNLSAVQFRSLHLVESVFSALAASGLPAHRLELEITESVLLQNNESTLETLHQLRSLGVRIAMDDFGTGYSSLSYLRSFPFDKIKIDRCFVADLADATEDSLAILRAVAGLGISLGIETTAEGVESKEQVERVRQEGCTEMQGYFFSPPRPIREIASLLRSQERKSASAA